MRRLDEPLRVAIAGRVKAGKSTLLNALVGERLAATDAGECTRIVTWYRNALGYRVVAELAERRLARPRIPARGWRAGDRPRRPRTRRDRADRGRLAVPETDRADADRHARPRVGQRRDLRADRARAPRRRGRRARRRRRGPLPDAPPPSIRRRFPRGVRGPVGRPRLADQRDRRPVTGRRDRRRPAGRARLGPGGRGALRRRRPGARAGVRGRAGRRADRRDRGDAARGAVRLAAHGRRPARGQPRSPAAVGRSLPRSRR